MKNIDIELKLGHRSYGVILIHVIAIQSTVVFVAWNNYVELHYANAT